MNCLYASGAVMYAPAGPKPKKRSRTSLRNWINADVGSLTGLVLLPGRLRNPKFSAGSIRQYSGTLGFSHWLRFTCQWSEWTPPVPATIGASTRSPFNIDISAKIPLQDFVGAVPRYPLDWIVVSYSRVATGAFWDMLPVAASGHHSS